MTRINLVEPCELTDQHLLAEYRELPRVFRYATPSASARAPKAYCLGEGHVLFFCARTRFLADRHAKIVKECLERGFEIRQTAPLTPAQNCAFDYAPTADAVRLNKARLRDRLHANLAAHTYAGSPVDAAFYGED